MQINRPSQSGLARCLLLCALLAPLSLPVFGQAAGQMSPAVEAALPQMKLSPGATEAANIIGVAPLIERLSQIPREAGGTMSLEELSLRQRITEAIVSASLEIDGVLAEIESETDRIRNVRAQLEARRDRALAISNLAGLVAGGFTGVVGTALQFRDSTQKAGNVIGVAGGAISTALAYIGLRQQRGGQLSLGTAPNMLARILDRKAEFHSDYPEEIWTYLNHVPPSEAGAESRRQRLTKQWIEAGRLEAKSTPKGERRTVLLTSSASEQQKLTIDLLTDRAAMLGDVRAQVSLLKRDLSKLMLAIRAR